MNLVEAHDKTWRLKIEFAKNCTVERNNTKIKVSGIRVVAHHEEEKVSLLIIPVMDNGKDTGIVDVFIEHHHSANQAGDSEYVQGLCDKIIDHMDNVMQICEEVPNQDFIALINQEPEVFN